MLRGLFRARSFLDPDVEAWQLDAWAQLLDKLGQEAPFRNTPLVLPTREFFAPTEATGHARAEHLFAAVKAHMGMSQWPCVLRPQDESHVGRRVSEFVAIEGEHGPGGTFSVQEGGVVIITYSPELIDDPWGLVATLSHELSHYLLHSVMDPDDDETHELMTDLTVAYSGLGLFGANASFSFSQHGDAFSQGWRSRSSGYLSPPSWAFALAVFGELSGTGDAMDRYLRAEIDSDRKKAVRYLRQNPDRLAPLKALIGPV